MRYRLPGSFESVNDIDEYRGSEMETADSHGSDTENADSHHESDTETADSHGSTPRARTKQKIWLMISMRFLLFTATSVGGCHLAEEKNVSSV